MASFRFRKLTVNSVPGIQERFCLDDINAGINIIAGPNGSGKTSTRRALNTILWPDEYKDSKNLRLINLDAEAECGGVLYKTTLQSGHHLWFKDGRQCDWVSFVNSEPKGKYHLSLHDLVQDDGVEFARIVSALSVGGIDLDNCAEKMGVKSRHSSVPADISAYNRAKEDVRACKENELENEEREAELISLRAEAELLEHQIANRTLYRAAMEYRAADHSLKAAQLDLDTFPAQIKAIKGTEFREFTSVELELKELSENRVRLAVEIDNLKSHLSRASGAGGTVPQAMVFALNSYVDALTETRARVKDSRLKVEQCESKVEELRAQIFDVGEVSEAKGDENEIINSATIQELVRASRELNRLDAEINQLQGEISTLDEASHRDSNYGRLPSGNSLERGISALGQWLQVGQAEASDNKAVASVTARAIKYGLIVTGLSAVGFFAVLTAVTGSEGIRSLTGITSALLFLLIAVIQIVSIIWFRKANGKSVSQDASVDENISRIIDHYAQTGLDTPQSWSVKDVSLTINHLAEMRSNVADADRIVHRLRSLTDRLHAKQDKRKNLLSDAEASLFPIKYNEDRLPDLGYIAEFLRQVKDWQSAQVELAEAKAALSIETNDCESIAQQVDKSLESINFEKAAGDVIKIRAAIRQIESEIKEFSSCTSLLQNKEREAVQMFESYERLNARRGEIFKSVDIADGDSALLRLLCSRYNEYQRRSIDATVSNQQLHRARERVMEDPSYKCEAIFDLTVEQIQVRLDEIESAQHTLHQTNKNISNCEVSIKAAETSTNMEVALAALDAAAARINQSREDDLPKLLGSAIINHIKEVTYDVHRPVVLQRASVLLTKITHGKYELRFDRDAFHVYDTESGLESSIEELSCGTRVQLQIAVRLAFVEEQEKGEKFPLFLDETLGTSDDYRAKAIIDSMIELAKDGRQIFYFTAQTDEVAKWEQSLAEQGVSYSVFMLNELRKLSRINSTAKAVRVIRTSLKPVEFHPDTSHLAYGVAIGVPPIRVGYDDIGRVPLWYLIDNPKTLHELRTLNIDTFGPLASIHRNSSTLPVEGLDEFARKFHAIEHLLSATVRAANIGHGKAVDRIILLASPVGKSELFEQIIALAENLNGDASALIKSLRNKGVPGMRTSATNALEEYFREVGCLSDTEIPLTSDEVRFKVLQEVSGYIRDKVLDSCEINRFFERISNPPIPLTD